MRPTDLFSQIPLQSNDLAATIMGSIFFIGFFTTIVVKMLIKHQQQMASMMRQETSQQANETAALRDEMQQLKGLIQQQTIMLDDMHRHDFSKPEQLQERVR